MKKTTSSTSRRSILRSAASLAVAGAGAKAAATAPPLPTVRFGKYNVTRMICGSNPFYGFSHFNRLFDQHMREWMTPERVLQVLRQCEQNGINTWQLHYSDRAVTDFKRYRAEGGKIQIFMLAMGDGMDQIRVSAGLGPIGLAHHGGITDRKFRDGKMGEVRDFLKAIRDSGVMVGLSSHNPAVIEYVEDANWDIDYYMTCFYRVSRTHEEIVRELGEAPLGEIYMEKDPERMTRVVRQTRKPCLGFKILAAGRSTDKPADVAAAFGFALGNIKPTDAVIVGMWPQHEDQVAINAGYARKFAG